MAAASPINVTCNRYDQFPTGANTHEVTLNCRNVNVAAFGKLYSLYVDGAVYAQPLYIAGVQIPGRGRHNVLYIATMNDKLYAFDADRSGPPLWMRDFTNEMAGITPVPITDITNNNNLNIVGNLSIESTPVIDLSTNSLYLVARTKESGRYVQRLHSLNLCDGTNKTPPAVIQAGVRGSARDAVDGSVRFDPKAGNQRPALALVNGQILIAWASHEDLRPYHGWIMSYDARTLKQTGAFCTTPDMADGGIWQSGRGPAVDASGAVYYEIGNGGWDGRRNFGTSVVKLRVGASGIAVEDYFTPHDYEHLNARDVDLGSTGPLLIPGTNTLVCGNKLGVLFLLNSNDLGHMTQDDRGIRETVNVNGGRVMAGPVYWVGPSGPTLLIWCEADFPKAFRWNGQLLQTSPFLKGTVGSHGSPGGALTISSDGIQSDTGVLWATTTNGRSADHGNTPGVLHAFKAETLEEIWNSEENAKRDRLGTLIKFVPPLVVAGKVYVPNYDNAVDVYGTLPPRTARRQLDSRAISRGGSKTLSGGGGVFLPMQFSKILADVSPIVELPWSIVDNGTRRRSESCTLPAPIMAKSSGIRSPLSSAALMAPAATGSL